MDEELTESPIRVLHVDDESRFGDLVREYLEELDETITVFSERDAQSGLERLETELVDCVVSDYQMPRTDGLEFLDAVREEFPNLPFILFTGQGSEEIASEALNAGVESYLQKDGIGSYKLLLNRIRQAVSRRRSKHQARVAQDRLIQLYEQTDGFYVLDEEWTITYWNQQIAERTGISPEEAVGNEFWEIFPGTVGSPIRDNFDEAMDKRERVEFEYHSELYDYWVELRVYPVSEGLFTHSRDITEKREQSQELRYRNEILESFASTVSHDLRNPLSVAEGNLQLARKTGDFEHLEEVTQAHNRMQNLIDELLRMARGTKEQRSALSLKTIAKGAWSTVSSTDSTLVIEDDLTLQAYDSQLRRLFENLLWNALDHGGATEIRIGTFEDGFYVEDDGVGIDSSEHERVFQSGFSTAGGPGYGLSIVRGICDIHGWDIFVRDGADGGARFEVVV